MKRKPGGLYDICKTLKHGQTHELSDELIATKEVPVHPLNTGTNGNEAAKRALARAGYEFDEIVRLTQSP